jgi:hypothetical protein
VRLFLRLLQGIHVYFWLIVPGASNSPVAFCCAGEWDVAFGVCAVMWAAAEQGWLQQAGVDQRRL